MYILVYAIQLQQKCFRYICGFPETKSLFQFMPVFTQTCFKFRWKKIKWVLSKDTVRVDISFLTHEISGRQEMEDASYCICDLGTEDIVRGRASYSLERDEEGGVFNLVFNVNADLL